MIQESASISRMDSLTGRSQGRWLESGGNDVVAVIGPLSCGWGVAGCSVRDGASALAALRRGVRQLGWWTLVEGVALEGGSGGPG